METRQIAVLTLQKALRASSDLVREHDTYRRELASLALDGRWGPRTFAAYELVLTFEGLQRMLGLRNPREVEEAARYAAATPARAQVVTVPLASFGPLVDLAAQYDDAVRRGRAEPAPLPGAAPPPPASPPPVLAPRRSAWPIVLGFLGAVALVGGVGYFVLKD